MEVVLQHREGLHFDAITGSGHTIAIDGAPEAGGANLGPRPMEMVLVALGSCSGIDVVLMIQKMRVALEGFSVRLDGIRREQEPRIYETIHLQYHLDAPELTETQAKRAVHLSVEKYCSVSEMLRGTVDFTIQVYLNGTLIDEFS